MGKALFFLAALSSIGSVRGQQSALSGPVEGFLFDAPSRSLRAVVGSLGAASLGPAIARQLDFASVAPGKDYAIVSQGGQAILVTGLRSGEPSEITLQGASANADSVAWSNDGSVAVLYSRTGAWIQIVSGLPGSATTETPVDLSALGGEISTAAISSRGPLVTAGITGDQAGVYEISSGSALSPLVGLAKPIGLAFSEDGGALYALDGATNQISEVNLADKAVQTWTVGAEDAIGLRAARDAANRKVLYVVTRTSRRLLTYDRATHQSIASTELSFDPTMIEPLGPSSFLLRGRSKGGDPLWSFTAGTEPAVYFVPVPPERFGHRREVRRR